MEQIYWKANKAIVLNILPKQDQPKKKNSS